MQKVKMAIIGMGGMGRKYAEIMNSGGENFPLELAVVCCRKEEAKAWAREHLKDSVCILESSEEVFAHADLYDAVLIVTPSRTHPDLAVQAFSLGKHVFIDKPSGSSILDCDRMNTAARESGKKFAIMYHHRKYAKYERVKQLIEEGTLGKINRASMVNTRYFRTVYYHKSGPWRSSWTGEGGGVLMNQAQHPMDIWQWLFGMPESIYANIPFGKYNGFGVDDESTLVMTYANGMTGTFIASTGEAEDIERLEISGTKGSIRLDGDTMEITTYGTDLTTYRETAQCTERQQLTQTTWTETFHKDREPYEEMLRNFGEAVLHDAPIVAPGYEGRNALEITNAAYLSAWTGVRQTLPIDPVEYQEQLDAHRAAEK